mmetsp:Transcript_52283/g.124719  ORF Transcript_52283/g.124719 Transcript_52283/m.124719 type:complete len:435 (+) Transcript_52283:165-1469(+)
MHALVAIAFLTLQLVSGNRTSLPCLVTECPSLLQVSSGQHSKVSSEALLLERQPGDAPSALTEGANPTEVLFKIFVKSFYGVNFADSSWSSDLVLHLTWTDPRAATLVPAGTQNISLSSEEATASGVWLPNVGITNLASWSGLKQISGTVTIDVSGTVTTTERHLVELRSRYEVVNYPFDSQELLVRIASSVFMADKLTIHPDLASDELFSLHQPEVEELGRQGWKLVDMVSRNMTEEDGPLVKSRGELRLFITRDWTSVFNIIFLPEIIMTLVPWSIFFSPLHAPYAMPRVASSLIPLLCMVGFMQKTASMMPHSSGWTWLDIYEATCLLLIVLSFKLNALLQYVYHDLKLTDRAELMQIECRYFYGISFAVLNGLAFLCRHLTNMALAGTCTSLLYFIIFAAIMLKAWYDIRQEPPVTLKGDADFVRTNSKQ